MMQTPYLTFSSLILAGTAAMAQVQADRSQPSGNLITSPSFEGALTSRGLPRGWTRWPVKGGNYRAEVVEGGRSGKKCLKIEGENASGCVFANGVEIDRNRRYALRGHIRVQGGKDAKARIQFNYFHNHKWLGIHDESVVTGQYDDWRLLAKTDRADEVPDASSIWISCVLEGTGTAWFDDLELVAYDRNNLPEDFDKRFGPSNLPAELAVLERYIGTWDTRITTKPGVWVPDGLKTKGVETLAWALGRKFIQGKNVLQPGNIETMSIMTYDAEFGVFRSWNFDSGGNFPRNELIGHWDEGTETLTFTGVDPKEVTVTATVRFVSSDRIEWQAVWRARDGSVLMEMEAVNTRSESPRP